MRVPFPGSGSCAHGPPASRHPTWVGLGCAIRAGSSGLGSALVVKRKWDSTEGAGP